MKSKIDWGKTLVISFSLIMFLLAGKLGASYEGCMLLSDPTLRFYRFLGIGLLIIPLILLYSKREIFFEKVNK